MRAFLPLAVAALLAPAAGAQITRAELVAIERQRVVAQANRYLDERPVTVTATRATRSSGGPHDFYSEGDYWWPNPADTAGPYIRRDGETNPANFVAHRDAMRRLSQIVPALAAAYEVTHDARYARAAEAHLRAWFVDSATRMTPNLLYGQAIKGVATGRGIGIIDTIHLVEVAQAIRRLEAFGALAEPVREGTTQWFRDYLGWLTTHPYGRAERDNGNNHSAAFALQVAEFATLVGDTVRLADMRRFFVDSLLAQVGPNGGFPKELARTKPYGYSLFQLDVMGMLAEVLSTPAQNMWRSTTPDGRGMAKALAYMYPYIADRSRWPLKPDVMYFDQWPIRHPALLFGGLALGEPRYVALWRRLNPDPTVDEVVRNYPVRQPLLWMRAPTPEMTTPARTAAVPARAIVSLDTGWRFAADDRHDLHDVSSIPAAQWARVSLPHTWNALDATDEVPGYHRGAGWYLRRLALPAVSRAHRLVLHFDGANTITDVWVNGRHAGGHRGGYLPFDVDVHDFVRRGENEVAVRVSNEDDLSLIPSRRGDYVIFGGLTRGVSLVTTPAVALSVLTVRTPEATAAQGRVTVTAELRNPAGTRGSRTVEATLSGATGDVVSRAASTVTLSGDTVQRVALDLPPVHAPALWSPSSPALYALRVTLAGGGALDRMDERVGFRSYRFEANGAFYLNGARLLIRGTQRHEETAGLGGAVPAAMQVADMAAIKAMGANFVRLAHYPQHPAVYRAADSLGLLLWDELPWDRGGVGDSAWQATTRRLLVEQVRANGNHPSIIVWSLGNEVQDVIEPPNAGDTPTLRRYLASLRELARTLDPARPTAMRKFDAGADLVDVYSPSIWAGWYGGVYRGYEAAITAARAKFPRLLHMEYGADAHYGRHTETPITGEGRRIDPSAEERVGAPVANVAREGDWSESYQTDLLDWHLGVSERLDWFAGSAQWVFRDFATPLRPDNPIPYVNEKGLLTRDGRRKDAYYVFASWWTTTPRFAYIVSHQWPERSGAPGQARTVRVYSNCDAVALTLNGAAQGERRRVPQDFPAQGLRWEVHFAEGANALDARCTGAGDRGARDTLTVRYTTVAAGRPTDIRLATRQLENGHLLVEATLVDAAGHTVLASADRVYFDHEGGGRLVADQGTPTGSRVIEAANGRAAIELEPPLRGSRAIVIARTQDLNGTRLVVEGR